jgi:hypothetical protein
MNADVRKRVEQGMADVRSVSFWHHFFLAAGPAVALSNDAIPPY